MLQISDMAVYRILHECMKDTYSGHDDCNSTENCEVWKWLIIRQLLKKDF